MKELKFKWPFGDWLQNQVRQGAQERLYHVERALKINSETTQ